MVIPPVVVVGLGPPTKITWPPLSERENSLPETTTDGVGCQITKFCSPDIPTNLLRYILKFCDHCCIQIPFTPDPFPSDWKRLWLMLPAINGVPLAVDVVPPNQI